MSERIEEILNNIQAKQEDEESQGIVFLRGGFDVFIESHFKSLREIWLLYKKRKFENSKQEVDKILKDYTVGGVISANSVSHMDINEIVGMIEVDDFMNPSDLIDSD